MFIFLGDKAFSHRGQSWTNAYVLVIFTAAILDSILKYLTLLLVDSLKIKMQNWIPRPCFWNYNYILRNMFNLSILGVFIDFMADIL